MVKRAVSLLSLPVSPGDLVSIKLFSKPALLDLKKFFLRLK